MSTDTRRRIIDATLETLRAKGAAGTSAREIARAGGFNTSLLFYHYGSVEGALVAAAKADTNERINRYAERLERVDGLLGLITVAREMHAENLQEGHVTVLVQMLAATSAHPDIRAELATVFDPWIDLIRQTLARLLGEDGLPGIAGNDDLAVGITSLFLGLELVTMLDETAGRASSLLDSLGNGASLLAAVGLLGTAADHASETAPPQGLRPHRVADPLADLPGPTGPV